MKVSRYLLFLFFFFLSFSQTFSITSDLLTEENKKAFFFNSIQEKIISRADWWADESYRYLGSNEWKKILSQQENGGKNLTEKQKKENALYLQQQNEKYIYINKFFFQDNIVFQKIISEGQNKLAWPIQKTEYVKSIIIHHTADDYASSYAGIKTIYKYHAISRQWWDIGYNYVIWYDGEIFEWRAGGDYVVWAHALWNNRSTVGISVMGNYNKKPISEKQYTALKNLVRYLAYKYWINLNDTFPLHEDCSWKDCPLGIKTQDYYTLAWHKDGGITSCPWNELYKQMQKIRKEVQYETRLYTQIKNPVEN